MNKFVCIALLVFSGSLVGQTLPEGFVYLHKSAPSIQKELRYLSKNNFIGKPIQGYQRSNIIVSSEAAKALKKIKIPRLCIFKNMNAELNPNFQLCSPKYENRDFRELFLACWNPYCSNTLNFRAVGSYSFVI